MYARLEDTKVVPMSDAMAWAEANEKSKRVVSQTCLSKRRHILVSTVFLGIDHGWNGQSLWFETMVFGTSIHDTTRRYATYEEAVKGHADVLRRARQAKQVRYRRENGKAYLKRLRRRLKKLVAKVAR